MNDRHVNQMRLLLYAGFLLIVIGAFTPWARIGPFTTNGTEGDGVLTLLLALGGSVLAFFDKRPRGMLIATSAAGLALVIGAVSFLDISADVDVGYGLYMTIVGALIATLASGVLAFGLFKRPGGPVQTSDGQAPTTPSE
jgi:peptidoglycan/LPS O-acetylase OafA/YrhL